MSFRRQLLLSIAALVIIPAVIAAVAVGRIVGANENAKTDARLDASVRVAAAVTGQDERRVASRVRRLQDDVTLRRALASGDPARIRSELRRVMERFDFAGARARIPGGGDVRLGTQDAVGVSHAQVPVEGGTATLSFGATPAAEWVRRMNANTGVPIALRVAGGNEETVTSADFPARERVDLSQVEPVTSGRWRTQRLPVVSMERIPHSVVFALRPQALTATLGTTLLIVAVVGFLIIGITLGLALMRSLRRRIQTFLDAAEQLGEGDYSAVSELDVRGDDEFAQLGHAFIGMSHQIDQRVDQLERERARVQSSLLRIGEAFGATLDRDRLIELLVESAVDGLAGDSGRAMVPPAGGGAPEPVSATGEVLDAWDILADVERAVLATRRRASVSLGGMHAIAEPLPLQRGDHAELGVIAVARRRPFEPDEYPLLTFLTEQASVSLRNIGRHEDVARESVTDNLTGLANRRRFDDVLAQAAARATDADPVGLVMIDLDHFKSINDTHGHQFGDTVLQAVAQVTSETARDRDVAARYGGEELAVILAKADTEGAREFAERLLHEIAALQLGDDATGPVAVTASFGVAALPDAGTEVNELVRAADEALYRAKRGGRNRVEVAEPPAQQEGKVL